MRKVIPRVDGQWLPFNGPRPLSSICPSLAFLSCLLLFQPTLLSCLVSHRLALVRSLLATGLWLCLLLISLLRVYHSLSIYACPCIFVSIYLSVPYQLYPLQAHIHMSEVSLDRERGNRRDVTLQPSPEQMEPISPIWDRPSIHAYLLGCAWVCVCNNSLHPFRPLLVMQLNASLYLKAITCQHWVCVFSGVYLWLLCLRPDILSPAQLQNQIYCLIGVLTFLRVDK